MMMPDRSLPPDQRASQYLLMAASDLIHELAVEPPALVALARFAVSASAYLETTGREATHHNMSLITSAALAIARAEASDSELDSDFRFEHDWGPLLKLASARTHEVPEQRHQRPYIKPANSLELLDMLELGKMKLSL